MEGAIRGERVEGERLRWVGQPLTGRMPAGSIALVLFAIPFLAFGIFRMVHAIDIRPMPGPAPGLLKLFPLSGGIPIVAGLALLLSPLRMARKTARTACVITDRRAIVFRGGFRTVSVRSFGPQALGDIERRRRADGSGDLIFARDSWRDSDGDRRTGEVGFLAVRDVKAIEEMIRALTECRESRSSPD